MYNSNLATLLCLHTTTRSHSSVGNSVTKFGIELKFRSLVLPPFSCCLTFSLTSGCYNYLSLSSSLRFIYRKLCYQIYCLVVCAIASGLCSFKHDHLERDLRSLDFHTQGVSYVCVHLASPVAIPSAKFPHLFYRDIRSSMLSD